MAQMADPLNFRFMDARLKNGVYPFVLILSLALTSVPSSPLSFFILSPFYSFARSSLTLCFTRVCNALSKKLLLNACSTRNLIRVKSFVTTLELSRIFVEIIIHEYL